MLSVVVEPMVVPVAGLTDMSCHVILNPETLV